LGACLERMATYILIICQNYIIPNLGEYISSKSVDNCKSWQSSIDFTKKCANIFYSKISENIQKKRVGCPFIFENESGKKKSTPKNKLFWPNQERKKRRKKLLQSYNTPCLNSQSVTTGTKPDKDTVRLCEPHYFLPFVRDKTCCTEV